MKRTICYIGFGSNLGNPIVNCRLALDALGRLPHTEITAVSSLYETEPICSEGPWFINGVVEIFTPLSPAKLLQACRQIESTLGRPPLRSKPLPVASPRTMDLDILLYGERVLNTPDLQIPHPRMHERGFVLIPLAEIAPNGWHPVLKKDVYELLEDLKDAHEVKQIASAYVVYPHGGS